MTTTVVPVAGTTLRTTHPCCGGAIRLRALEYVPRERYSRRCVGCGFGWTVTRTTLMERDGARLDRLDWDQEAPTA